jgi:hypothetical protein
MSATANPLSESLDGLSALVRQAQDELGRSVQICGLNDDPLRHHLAALSTALGAMHQIFLDGSRAVGAQIANAPHPVGRAELAEFSERIAAEVAQQTRKAMRDGGRDLAHHCVARLDHSTTILFWSLLVCALVVGGLLDRFIIGPGVSKPLVYICSMTGPNGTCDKGAWMTRR